VDSYVSQLCQYNSDANAFKTTLRDFLIQLREYAGQDTEALFLEDKEAELQSKAAAEREAALKVPGMLKPSQIDQDEEI
jgi:exportin-1